MAASLVLFSLLHLLFVSNVNSYSVTNRVPNKLDNHRYQLNNTVAHTPLADCIPVQAVKDFTCATNEKDPPAPYLQQSVCRKHLLCYACGFVHGLTKRKCDRLFRIHMFELCSRNVDCLKKSLPTQFQVGIYRLSAFSDECYNQCILNYLYSSAHKS